MGRKRTGKRKYQVENPHDYSDEIARLTARGYKPAEIAEILGITTQTVSNNLCSPRIQARLAAFQLCRDKETVDAMSILHANSAEVAEIYTEIAKNPSTPLGAKLRACEGILDRTGYAPAQRVQVQAQVTHLTLEDIETIKQRARDAGLVIEVGGHPAIPDLTKESAECATPELDQEAPIAVDNSSSIKRVYGPDVEIIQH